MKRISYLSKGASAHSGRRFRAGNPAPRWRTVFIALTLALSIGSAGQTPLAQAAPAGAAEIWWWVIANKVRGTALICIGDDVAIDVRVGHTTRGIEDEDEGVDNYAVGVKVKSSVQDSSIGTLSPWENTTGWDRDNPRSAPFSFHAKKAGTTTISFWGVVERRDVKAEPVTVTVQPCKFKVATISRWHLPGIHEFDILAMIDEADMTADAKGRLAGRATVNWAVATTVLSPYCSSAKFTVSPSQADLTGQMDDSGLLVVNLTFQPAAASVTQVCFVPGGTETTSYQYQLTPDPLSLSVPSSGGVSTQAQVLVVTWGTGTLPLSGSSVIVVIPEVD